MSTFDAGAIEARLILDRSDFQKGLNAAKAQAKRADHTKITFDIDVDGFDELVALDGIIEGMDNQNINVGVDIDNSALGELAALDALIGEYDSRDVDVRINIKPRGIMPRLVALRENLEAIRDLTINISTRGVAKTVTEANLIEHEINDIPRSHTTFFNTAGIDTSTRHMDGWRILIWSVIALLPVLTSSVGALGGGIAALSGILVGAGGAATVLALGMTAAILRMKEFEKETGPIGDAARLARDSLDRLSDAWEAFGEAVAIPAFGVMTQAVDILTMILPGLVPVFNAVAVAASGALTDLSRFFAGPEWKGILDFFADFGADAFGSVLRIIGNLALFIIRLAQAFEPLERDMLAGLERITKGWADWAKEIKDSDGLEKFMDWVSDMGPRVIDMFVEMGAALINIGIALEPFSGPMIDGITRFFQFIANMDPDILGPIAFALFTLVGAFKLLAPLVSGVMAVLPALGGIFGAIASPAGLAALAIGGIVAAVALAVAKSESARDTLQRIWESIKETVNPIIQDIRDHIEEHWPAIEAKTKEVWEAFSTYIEQALLTVETILGPALATITWIWQTFGDDILAIWGAVFGGLGSDLTLTFEVLTGILQMWRGIMTGDWQLFADGLTGIFSNMWSKLWGLGQGGVVGIARILWGVVAPGNNAFAQLRAGVNRRAADTYANVRTTFSAMTTWLRNRVGPIASAVVRWFNPIGPNAGRAGNAARVQLNSFVGWLGSRGGAIGRAVAGWFVGIPTAMRNAVNAARGWINWLIGGWNNLSFSLPGVRIPIPGAPDIEIPGFSIGSPNIPYLADGGIATDATLAMIGEGRESEAILPLSKLEDLLARERGAGDGSGGRMETFIARVVELLEQILSREPIEYNDYGQRRDPKAIAEDLWLLTKGR